MADRRTTIRLALGVAALVAMVVLVRVLPVDEWLRQVQDRAREMGALGGLVYGLVYVVCALLLVPGSVLTLGAGAVFGLGWGLVIVFTAANVAAALAFLIARHLARTRVEAMARKHARFGAIEAAIREEGWKVVALLRLSPVVPFSVSNYLYGLAPVDFGPYMLASAAGMLPGTLLYVYLGVAGSAAAGGRTRSPLEWALLAAGLLATLAVTVVLTRKARQHLAKRAD